MRTASLLLILLTALPAAAQWPMFGGSPSRNMVSPDKSFPLDFQILNAKEEKELKKVKWSVELGSKAYGGPVIAGGKVFVGTNNANPRDPKNDGNLGVLQCFDAATGKYLWQITHPMPEGDIFADVTKTRLGLLSTPAVDGDMLFYVTPGAEVVAASTDGKVAWTFDMMKKLGVHPFHCSNCSPLVVDDLVMLITGNGIAEGGEGMHTVPSPKAPSFLALKKKDGTVAWQSNLPGNKIIEGQWSNPALALVNGKKLVIFPGGDGILYALKAEDGSLAWKFNAHPDGVKHEPGEPVPLYFVSTPVVHDNKVYIGMGTMPEHAAAPRFGWFLCIDATRTGDISPKNLDHKDLKNKDSGLIWSYGGPITPRPKKGRSVVFGPTISTAAIANGLVFISEEASYTHCLDARTGEKQWVQDFKTAVWGSPYVIGDKVLLATEDGMLHVLAADRKLKVLARDEAGKQTFVEEITRKVQPGIVIGETLQGTPVAVGGTLYLQTSSMLYAIGEKK